MSDVEIASLAAKWRFASSDVDIINWEKPFYMVQLTRLGGGPSVVGTGSTYDRALMKAYDRAAHLERHMASLA